MLFVAEIRDDCRRGLVQKGKWTIAEMKKFELWESFRCEVEEMNFEKSSGSKNLSAN
jgi:hypothetical protein